MACAAPRSSPWSGTICSASISSRGSELSLDPEITQPLFFLSYGWIGVQLFFVLSGFVLYLPFARGRAKLETGADWKKFYLRRAARLLRSLPGRAPLPGAEPGAAGP